MVQLMGSLHFDKVEDFTEEEYGPLAKRPRCSSVDKQGSPDSEIPVLPFVYNPLAEPSPLGLRLKKSPSLVNLIQMRLSQESSASMVATSSEVVGFTNKKDAKGDAASSTNDKLKASNFPASSLRIGSWEYKSRYEGDLVAKCYYAKHKLVWEVLEDGLKSKIEVQWSDIAALKAECPDNGPGTLTLVLARQPAFFRETNPQPRKHTLWQSTPDFTNGQASINKLHYLQCPPGVLNRHYEKLLQCDTRLSILSRQPEIFMESPYFESQNLDEAKIDGGNQLPATAEGSASSSVSEDATSAVDLQFPSSNLGQNALAVKHEPKEATSPSSGMDVNTIESKRTLDEHDSKQQKSLGGLEVPGLRPSMSISDLINHVQCFSEQITSGNLPSDKASECQEMLQNISQVLLNDTQPVTGLDEKSLMKKVNSLCCLLQDPIVASSSQVSGENRLESAGKEKRSSFDIVTLEKGSKGIQALEGSSDDGPGFEHATGMQRKDSYGDLLMNLPRIASLPKFLFGIVEDDGYHQVL